MGLVTIVLLIGLLGQINLDIKLHKVVLCIAHVLEESTAILTAVSIKQTLSTYCSPGTTEFSLWSKSCRILQMRKRRLKEANCLSNKIQQISGTISIKPRSDFRSCSLDPSFSRVIHATFDHGSGEEDTWVLCRRRKGQKVCETSPHTPEVKNQE